MGPNDKGCIVHGKLDCRLGAVTGSDLGTINCRKGLSTFHKRWGGDRRMCVCMCMVKLSKG